jgi:hypothetical protein
VTEIEEEDVVQDAVFTVPASYAQELVWFTAQVSAGRPLFNVVDRIILPAGADAGTARAALEVVVQRHETLRTELRVVDGRLWQVIHPVLPVELPVTDLGGLDATERERAAWAAIEEYARAGLPADGVPLWRARVLRLDEATWWLLLVAHHVIVDGTGPVNLHAEVGELCAAAVAGRARRCCRSCRSSLRTSRCGSGIGSRVGGSRSCFGGGGSGSAGCPRCTRWPPTDPGRPPGASPGRTPGANCPTTSGRLWPRVRNAHRAPRSDTWCPVVVSPGRWRRRPSSRWCSAGSPRRSRRCDGRSRPRSPPSGSPWTVRWTGFAGSPRKPGAAVGLPELLAKIVAGLYATHPLHFATLTPAGEIVHAGGPAIGVTVDAGTGLYTPVIRDAQDLDGMNFLLALNDGPGTVFAQPIIPPGVACALSVPALHPEVIIDPDGTPTTRTVADLGLAYDHHLINGAQAGAFLHALHEALQLPPRVCP